MVTSNPYLGKGQEGCVHSDGQDWRGHVFCHCEDDVIEF